MVLLSGSAVHLPRLLTLAVAGLALVGATSFAVASDCAGADRSRWMDASQVTAAAAALGYSEIDTVEVSGGCYLLRGETRGGRDAVVVLHPVTGAVIRATIGRRHNEHSQEGRADGSKSADEGAPVVGAFAAAAPIDPKAVGQKAN